MTCDICGTEMMINFGDGEKKICKKCNDNKFENKEVDQEHYKEERPIIKTAQEAKSVTVTDIQMPFGSMIVFMIKWAFASIPAAIILGIVWSIFAALFGGLIAGLFG